MTNEGEAKRRDEDFAYVAAWGRNEDGTLNLKKEWLEFENVKLVKGLCRDMAEAASKGGRRCYWIYCRLVYI